MASESRMPESNPFVEIATHLFLEDIATKVGIAGLNNYLVSLAKNLAGSMPKEEYTTWSEFLSALSTGQSILSTFEEVRPITDHCMSTFHSPFERGWREYAKRVGAFAPVPILRSSAVGGSTRSGSAPSLRSTARSRNTTITRSDRPL